MVGPEIIVQVKSMRLKRGRTQSQVCDAIGIPQGYYSQIESGRKFPGTVNLVKLVRYFDCSLLDLYEVRDER
jgi:transcriptional regulator with XRE-family HTH domain